MCRFQEELSKAVSPHGERQCWNHIWKEEKKSENKKPKEEIGETEWSKVKAFVIIPLKGRARSSMRTILISEDNILTGWRTSQEFPPLKFHRITENHYTKNQVSKTWTRGGHVQTLMPKYNEQTNKDICVEP